MMIATATLLRRVNNRILPSLVWDISSAGGVRVHRVLSSSSSKASPSSSSTPLPTKDVTQEAIDKSERLHIELTEVI